MDEPIICPVCSTANAPSQRFCGSCGSSLVHTCEKCGAENPLNFKFCGNCGLALGSAQLSPTEQRRWATVVFADMSGFTRLSEGMDPEDVRAHVDRALQHLGEIVGRFDGNVLEVIGDELFAIFGAPVAHEDDAERAVRAALEMKKFITEHTDEFAGLSISVGVNTGDMIFAPLGPETKREFTVLGDAVNIAKRLQSAAPSGSVYVGSQTHAASSRAILYREVGPVEAKGKAETVTAWEALEATLMPAARPLGRAPLVGRDSELKLLETVWGRVLDDRRPHLVTIIGEPGVGKSRLAAEFQRRISDQAQVFGGRCLAYGEALSYQAFSAILKEAAGIQPDDDMVVARDKLGTFVDSLASPNQRGLARHLALLVGVETEEDRTIENPDQKALHVSARRLLESAARANPTCIIVEDIHWADAALLELLASIPSGVRQAPLLVLTTSRPEITEKSPTWGGGVAGFSSIQLEPLSETNSRELVSLLAKEHGLLDELTQRVAEDAGGNPLFAEELVAMAAEGGLRHDVPTSIRALIQARLDGLPPDEKRAVQFAGVYGVVFWEGGLRAFGINGRCPEILESLEGRNLFQLADMSRFLGDREFAFRHVLIRDVAYESVPKARRAELHQLAGDWIENAAGDRVEEYFDQIAHHAVHSNQIDRAIAYLNQAADRARISAAHPKEAELLAQAIELANASGQESLSAELGAKRGRALSQVGNWADARSQLEAVINNIPESDPSLRVKTRADLATACFWLLDTTALKRHAESALEIAEKTGDPELILAATALFPNANTAEGDVDAAMINAKKVLDKALEHNLPVPYYSLWNLILLHYWTGDFDTAYFHAQRGIKVARQMHDTSATMWNLPHMGLALAGGGRYREAHEVFVEAKTFGLEYQVYPLLARSVAMNAGFHLDLFDFEGAEAIQNEAVDLARTHNFEPPSISAGIDLLLNYARRGEVARAEAMVDQVGEAVSRGALWHGWLWSLRFDQARAEISLAKGDFGEAIRWASECIQKSAQKHRLKYLALGHLTRGEALSSQGKSKDGLSDFREAVKIGRTMKDPAIQLKTLSGLLSMHDDRAAAEESHTIMDKVIAEMPTAEMLERFRRAPAIERLLGL